jgi:hypothetical protein
MNSLAICIQVIKSGKQPDTTYYWTLLGPQMDPRWCTANQCGTNGNQQRSTSSLCRDCSKDAQSERHRRRSWFQRSVHLLQRAGCSRPLLSARSKYLFSSLSSAGTPIPPRIKELLLYILGQEGQSSVTSEGEYLRSAQALALEFMRRKQQ